MVNENRGWGKSVKRQGDSGVRIENSGCLVGPAVSFAKSIKERAETKKKGGETLKGNRSH